MVISLLFLFKNPKKKNHVYFDRLNTYAKFNFRLIDFKKMLCLIQVKTDPYALVN